MSKKEINSGENTKLASRFVFCAFRVKGYDPDTVVYIGTREEWEKRGCLSDGYTEDEEKIADAICNKYKLGNMEESTYESYNFTAEELNKLIDQEPDFAYDEQFAAFIKSTNGENG